MRGKAPGGVVYLVHFSEPYRHARHYTGWTVDLDARLAEHKAGRGARLLQVIAQAGIGWTLARTWGQAGADRRADAGQPVARQLDEGPTAGAGRAAPALASSVSAL